MSEITHPPAHTSNHGKLTFNLDCAGFVFYTPATITKFLPRGVPLAGGSIVTITGRPPTPIKGFR